MQHDGGHRAYSNRRWVDKLMAMSLDLLGGSSYVWDKQQTCVHRSYTNITVRQRANVPCLIPPRLYNVHISLVTRPPAWFEADSKLVG